MTTKQAIQILKEVYFHPSLKLSANEFLVFQQAIDFVAAKIEEPTNTTDECLTTATPSNAEK